MNSCSYVNKMEIDEIECSILFCFLYLMYLWSFNVEKWCRILSRIRWIGSILSRRMSVIIPVTNWHWVYCMISWGLLCGKQSRNRERMKLFFIELISYILRGFYSIIMLNFLKYSLLLQLLEFCHCIAHWILLERKSQTFDLRKC